MNIRLSIPDGFLDEEIRNDYHVSSMMKKVWAVELDLIAELLRVSEKYKLAVYSCGGTTLGAVRHSGFVPWDDDVDMMMYREDYEKLCRISRQEFTEPYFFQTEDSDPGSARGHAQLRNSSTTAILNAEKGKKIRFNQGIFIDIFPLDNLPEDAEKRKRFLELEDKRLHLSRRLLKGPSCSEQTIQKKIKGITYSIIKMVPIGKWLYRCFDKKAQQYNRNETKNVGIVALGSEKFVWPRKDIMNTIMMSFEMIKIPVPADYCRLLEKTYGDWKTPIRGGDLHGGIFFDPEKPYKEYIE